jgi:hypothetical protein
MKQTNLEYGLENLGPTHPKWQTWLILPPLSTPPLIFPKRIKRNTQKIGNK